MARERKDLSYAAVCRCQEHQLGRIRLWSLVIARLDVRGHCALKHHANGHRQTCVHGFHQLKRPLDLFLYWQEKYKRRAEVSVP